MIAFLMCSVLLFAITPKRTVHEIFGCHNSAETKTGRSASHHTQFNTDGFHCSCEQTEFQPGFVLPSLTELPAVPFVFQLADDHSLPASLFSIPGRIVSLRGPPALC